MISHSTENGNGVKIKSTSKRSLPELKIVIFRLTPSNGEGNNGEVRTLKCFYLQQAMGHVPQQGASMEKSRNISGTLVCLYFHALFESYIDP